MERILKASKKFTLGICQCGCNEIIAIRNKRKSLARFIRGHNIEVYHGSDHPSWKGGKSHDKDGYVIIWYPNHPRNICENYVHEHVLIMEKLIGRFLTDNEVVHHINEIKNDNRIENLMLMTEHDHKSYHAVKMHFLKMLKTH